MGQSHGRDATLDEALAAIESIDTAGYLVLRARAAGRIFGTRFRDPNDLVQEALLSIIEGAQHGTRKGRKWPISVGADSMAGHTAETLTSPNAQCRLRL